ncbi:MAG: hypothetical protein IKZ87_01640 [Actinomycetaceae bacterium]|nr:hypothetical protein [Actinomycetaceae bacterium]
MSNSAILANLLKILANASYRGNKSVAAQALRHYESAVRLFKVPTAERDIENARQTYNAWFAVA